MIRPYENYITRCRESVNDLVQHNVLYVRLAGAECIIMTAAKTFYSGRQLGES